MTTSTTSTTSQHQPCFDLDPKASKVACPHCDAFRANGEEFHNIMCPTVDQIVRTYGQD